WAAKGAASQRGENRAGASVIILVAGCRAADKNPLATGCVSGPGGIIRPADEQASHLRSKPVVRDLESFEPSAVNADIQLGWWTVSLRRRGRRNRAPTRRRRFELCFRRYPEEGDSHGVQTRFHRPAYLQNARIGVRHVRIVLGNLDLDDILGVQRKILTDRQAAARIERKIITHPLVSGAASRARLPRNGEFFPQGLDRHIAHGHAADRATYGYVSFEQGRRKREDVANVIESVARIIH